MSLFTEVANVIEIYVKAIEWLIHRFDIKFRGVKLGPIEIDLKARAESSYDETLKKIDQTKQHLSDAIMHIDTMKSEIIHKKHQLDEVIGRIQDREQEKEQLEEEFRVSKRLRDEEAERLRTLLGVTDLKESRSGKLAGFISGVLASLLAAAIFAVVSLLISHFGKSVP
jgi:K+/H+ antiporter YhaU regulatory subunit KhtT